MDGQRHNQFDQPIGTAVLEWTPRPRPPATPMLGRLCRVEPLDASRHIDDMHAAFSEAADGRDWTYLSVDYMEREAYRTWFTKLGAAGDPMPHVIVDQGTGKAMGTASFMRMDPANGVIEVGHILLAPRLQRTPTATEAMFLMMRRVFDELGYRRYEWKCDSLNAPSREAALRLGFRFESIFRQAIVYKGRNRDTAWFSIIDSEWPALKRVYERWLDPANFDEAGRQRVRLSDLTKNPAR